MADRLTSRFEPTEPQDRFLRSTAKIRGYGGAMGGGKSRCLCEGAFDDALDYPGLITLVCRAQHTSITGTTRQTMLEQVIPPDLYSPANGGRKLESNGQDMIQLWNGSVFHFIGLDDPIRWYSSEIGNIIFDEAQEIELAKVVRLITRLRQPGMPHRASFAFNPGNPGHWLQTWFIQGAERTRYGYRKPDLYVTDDADTPIGDAEFFFAKATDNPYLPPGYVEQTLAGLPRALRRRYLEGLWEFTDGMCYFDLDRLADLQKHTAETKPIGNGVLIGDIQKDFLARSRGKHNPEPPRVKFGSGPLTVWKRPVREREDEEEGKILPAHTYVVAVDPSSGKGEDPTGIQVLDVATLEQVAEVQAKLEPDVAAEWAYRLGRIYNDAFVVVEMTGGWGLAVDQKLKEFHYPRLYTRRVLDRLSRKFTDKVGFDTNVKTRNEILSQLEEAVRDGSLGVNSYRLVSELSTFVYFPRKGNTTIRSETVGAQAGCHDDLVMSMATAVHVALQVPRLRARSVRERHYAQSAVTGY